MADLLRWSVGMALPKKKDENQFGSGLPTFSIRNPLQVTQPVNNQIRTTRVNGFNTSNTGANSVSNNNNFQQQNDFQAQQIEQQRQQEQQRRLQEEQQRRQRLEQMRKQQEERQRQEQERRAQEQQARQQKQQQLLNSSLGGGSLYNSTSVGDRRAGMPQNANRGVLGMLGAQSNLERSLNPVKTESDKSYDKWPSTTSMDDLSKELDKARADNNTDWIRRIQQHSGKSTDDIDTYKKQVGAQNSELNLGRSAATDLRNVNDTKTYDNLDVNDSDNMRFFGRQNLLKKTFKSALGDDADVSSMSYHDVINAYNNASGDQQADIKKAIADEIVDQKKYANKGNQESLKSISYLADLNALLNQYGNEKGKSFGKQVGDWLSTGGFIGNIGGNALTEALGNVTGTEDSVKAHLEKQQNTRDDLGAVGAADAALTGISNTALNLGTGGWYGLANAGVNTANTLYGLDDKVLDFDDYGQASLRDKETGEKISELGNTALNDAFAIAGKVGIGPGLGKGSLKDLAKYAWQEPVWAGGTTMIQEGLSNLGNGKDFGDYDWGKVGQSFAANLGQDIGMDLFNLGRGRAQTKIAQQQSDGSLLKGLQDGNLRRQDDGTLAKVNPDGTTSRLSDSELAQAIRNESPARRVDSQTNVNNGITRLADLGYDVSKDVGSKTKKVAKKAADIANEHRLGGTLDLQYDGDISKEDAEPKTIYHGTNAVFEDFDERLPSVWFSDSDKHLAETGIQGSDVSKGLNVVKRQLPSDLKLANEDMADNLTKQQLIDRGYEGIVYTERGPNGDETYYEIFNPNKTLGKVSEDNNLDYNAQMPKDNADGSVSRLTDAEFAKAIGNDAVPKANNNDTINRNFDENTNDLINTLRGVGADIDENGNVRLFHRTTPENANKIYSTGEMFGKEADGSLYFSTNKDAQPSYGDSVVELSIPANKLALDDLFDNNADVRYVVGKSGQLENVSPYLITKNKTTKGSNRIPTTEDLSMRSADLGYDVSQEVGSKAKNVAKKAADIANEHPLGGITKLVDTPEVEGSGQQTNDNSDISHKNAQFELLQKTNPMQDDYHTGIRSADEINNLEDLVNKYDENEMFTYPDFTLDDARRAVEKGSIPVFSSYPIEAGTFVSPSKMMATDYAGGDANKVYSKEIPISDFAAIRSGDEGNYLPVKQQKVARTPEQQIYDAQKPKDNADVRYVVGKSGQLENVSPYLITKNKTTKGSNRIPTTEDLSMRSADLGYDVSKEVSDTTKKGIDKATDRAEVKKYYERYGEDFYEKMPENLKNRYEDMLDSQPRDGSGRYTDPITGETWIDSTAREKSQFAENTSANKNFSTETRSELKSDPLTYKPTTNEERLRRANEILSTKSLDEVDSYLRDNYFDVKDKYRNSGDTVLAGEFAKMLDADGQYGRATEIINKMSEIATKQGQQIQALSIMSNRSPEGIANMAQNAIQKGGGKVDGELRKQILSNTQEIGKIRAKMAALTTENSDISHKIMNGEGDLPALRKRQMEIGQEYRTCLDQEGRSFAKLSETVNDNSPRDKSIFGSIWRAGLLSGPRTHVGNAVSNTFQNALNAGADRIAAGLDWARTKITGGEREVVSSAGGRGKGLKRGLSAAGEVMKTGTNLWEGTEKVTSGQGANAWGHGGELGFKNKIADTMVAKPTNYVFRAMSAGDLPFRYSAFENAIRTEAKRQGMNQGYKGQALQDYINSRVATPDPDLQAYGIKKGNESVYDADTFLSRTMSSLDKQINKIDNKVGRNAAKTAKTLIAPFVKVPSKVLSTAVDYSPVGAVQAVVKKVGGSKNYSVGQFETDLAKSGLGSTAFVGLGYALSSAGLLTGGYPEEQKERDRWKAEGIEPNSVKIGDKYVSLNYLGPAAILMGMGAGVQKRQEKGQDPFTISVGAVGDTFNAFFEQSYVQGLNSAINAVKDSQRYGESYANSLARGLVPNMLRQTAVATDDKQRQVDNPLEAITSGIPGLSKTLDAKVDVYGREIENKQTLPLGQMWDALKISNSRETNDVIDEVSRLHSVDPSNKDLQVTPPQAQSSVSVNGVNVKLTDNQKSQLQKDIGAAALEGMQQVINSSQYQSLSDEEKASALNKARENAQKQVRKQFVEANNITADNNPGTRESGGSATGDFASKAITSATANTEGKSAITANNSLGQSSKDILNKYNSMSSEDWNNYLYGSSAESAAAEYNLAKAKYENSLANDELNDAQKIKKEKELRKLNVSKDWEKKYRDAYGLAGSKSDMQEFLSTLGDDERAETVGILNGLNRAMYEAGVIEASTYKSRSNAINGTTTTAKSKSSSKKSSSRKSSSSSKKSSGKTSSGMSSAEASALSDLAKTMVKNNNSNKASTPKAPETKRKMARTKSSGNKTSLNSYSTNLATKATVTKGAKRSIA